MSNHPHDLLSGRVGDYFEKNGFVAYKYREYTDISSDNACFPEYGYQTEIIVTETRWSDYVKNHNTL
jgi:hypothetical protein